MKVTLASLPMVSASTISDTAAQPAVFCRTAPVFFQSPYFPFFANVV